MSAAVLHVSFDLAGIRNMFKALFRDMRTNEASKLEHGSETSPETSLATTTSVEIESHQLET